MSPADIITSMTRNKTEELANLAVQRVRSKPTMTHFNQTDKLGSLLLYTNGFIGNLSKHAIGHYVQNFTYGGNFERIVCLGSEARTEWRNKLIDVYG